MVKVTPLTEVRASAKLYLTAFLVGGVGVGALAHLVTTEPMPWWPDTAIMGLPFGIVAALSAWQHRRAHQLMWSALKNSFQRH